MEPGLRRDDLLHPSDGLSLRAADVQPDEGEPSVADSLARVCGPEAVSLFSTVIKKRVSCGGWSLLTVESLL